MGKTFCLLKPEISDRIDEVERDIVENNFSIVKKKKLGWEWTQMRKTYSKENLNYGTKRCNKTMSFFIPYAITRKFGLNPPIEVLTLSSEGDTIRDFVKFCGPRDAMEYVKQEFQNTLRGKYGLGPDHSFTKTIQGKKCRFDFNGVHRTSKEEEFKTEPRIYFLN